MPRYEFRDGTSGKFWEIELSGSEFTVRYGSLGAKGREQTKSFATPELARREHDKLVAEKLRKGYAAVGDAGAPAAAPAAPPSGPAAPAGAPPSAAALRRDFYVYNEATGMLVTSARLGGKGWDNGGKAWEKGVRNGALFPVELVQDDPFVIRVVVGGGLESQEAEEWVGRLDGKLRVPDGDLVVCGGAEYVMEEFDDEDDSFMAEYVRHMNIPRGEYRATLYMYFGGVNGRACLQSARGGDEPEPLGEWFRRTRPGEPFPVWLRNRCIDDPAEDPGHEAEWAGAAKVEDPVAHYVDFLLHLVPSGPGEKIALPELSEGWFSTPTECREPARIPLGLPAREPEGFPTRSRRGASPTPSRPSMCSATRRSSPGRACRGRRSRFRPITWNGSTGWLGSVTRIRFRNSGSDFRPGRTLPRVSPSRMRRSPGGAIRWGSGSDGPAACREDCALWRACRSGSGPFPTARWWNWMPHSSTRWNPEWKSPPASTATAARCAAGGWWWLRRRSRPPTPGG